MVWSLSCPFARLTTFRSGSVTFQLCELGGTLVPFLFPFSSLHHHICALLKTGEVVRYSIRQTTDLLLANCFYQISLQLIFGLEGEWGKWRGGEGKWMNG